MQIQPENLSDLVIQRFVELLKLIKWYSGGDFS